MRSNRSPKIYQFNIHREETQRSDRAVHLWQYRNKLEQQSAASRLIVFSCLLNCDYDLESLVRRMVQRRVMIQSPVPIIEKSQNEIILVERSASFHLRRLNLIYNKSKVSRLTLSAHRVY